MTTPYSASVVTDGTAGGTKMQHAVTKRDICAPWRAPRVRPLIQTFALTYLLGMATCTQAAAPQAQDAPTSVQSQADTRDTLRFVDSLLDAKPPTLPAGGIPQPKAIAPGEQAWLDALKAKRQGMAQPPATNAPEAHYFVSFSMPDEVLAPLIAQAAAYGIPAHLRGMVNGDMRQTANAVLRLVKDRQQGGVSINPMAFTRYGITAVPALVVTCSEGSDRIAGNLALDAALTKIAEAGTCQESARRLLAQHTDTGATP